MSAFYETAEQSDALATIHRALELGVPLLDTADIYGPFTNEELVGKAIGGRRDEVQVATKFGIALDDEGTRGGIDGTPAYVRRACEASLRRLGTEWVDLYQIHCWDARTPLEETLSTLDDLVHEGKIRYAGASNYTAWQLAKSLGLAAGRGWDGFVSLQPEYSLITRDIERELLPLCREEGLAVLPWSPLAGGVLTGKYREGDDFPTGTRGGDTEEPITFTYRLHERAWNIVEAVRKVADELGKTPSQVSLNWVVHRPGVTAPIIGARNLSQLEDNLGGVGWQLEEEHWRALSWASAFPLGYPYDFIEYSDAAH